MINFPSDAEEFYALRDDRTNRSCGGRKYQSIACSVHLPSTAASAAVAQVMLLVAANLLSRWCRRVTIVMPTAKIHPALGMGNGDLGALLLAQMRDADPFGEFQIANGNSVSSAVALCIGDSVQEKPCPATVFVDASGWFASISTERAIGLPPTADCNWLGAIAAACLGVAQVFKLALEMPPTLHIRDGVLDLFGLAWSEHSRQARWPASLEIGNLLMVGAGSVGSSAAYCMRLSGLAGGITIVDNDEVKVENFNRSPIFGRRTVGLPKAKAVANFLAGSALSAKAVPRWWDEFLRERGRSSFDFDLWLPLANDRGVRLSMQHNLPPLMIHASTTSNWGVNHGRHIPGHDDCLADRFPADVTSAEMACATGQIETPETVVDAALPFASLFAGLLVVADMVRAQLPEYPQVPNFALFDFYGPLDSIHIWDRKPRVGCVCLDQGQSLHERFNGNTRYRQLFWFDREM